MSSCLYTADGAYQCSVNGPTSKSTARVRAPRENFYNEEGVSFYEHIYYTGRSVVKQQGRYDMGDMGIPNDFISSIKVPQGYQVIVFENNNFSGDSQTFSSDVPDLSKVFKNGNNWNDRISSFKVYRDGITVFDDCNFNGSSATKTIGSYNMDTMGVGNDSISSIMVAPGYRVTVYEDNEKQGNSTTFTSDQECLYPGPWNDKISSFEVSRV